MMTQTLNGGDAAREDRLLRASERWARLLLNLFPAGFRDDMGEAFVGTYRDRSRAALRRGGLLALAGIWLNALSAARGGDRAGVVAAGGIGTSGRSRASFPLPCDRRARAA